MMKTDIFYKKLLLLLLILMSGKIVHAQEKTSKKIEKSFKFTDNTKISIDNTYGDITINGWSKNIVQVAVSVEVNHERNNDAESLLSRIQTEIVNSGNIIKIQSVINKSNEGFFTKYFSKSSSPDLDKSNLKINVTVNAPHKAKLDITNKFGDIIVGNKNSKLKIAIEHGDLWVNDTITSANIDMKFGKISSKKISHGSITLKNGAAKIAKSDQLYITSSGSKLNIESVRLLELNSSKDEIYIKYANNLQGNLEFSKLEVDLIGDEVNLSTKIADVKLNSFKKTNPTIHLEQQSSEFNINVAGLSFKFDALLEQGLLRIPVTFKNINTEIINNSKKIRKINADYGVDATGNFTINGTKGIIIIKE